MNIRFYNRNGLWYADVPSYIEQGGTEEDCLMVAGADEWLDILSKGQDTIHLRLEETQFDGAHRLELQEFKVNSYKETGAIYTVEDYEPNPKYVGLEMWLCPVTEFVFGDYPKNIYYKIIKG